MTLPATPDTAGIPKLGLSRSINLTSDPKWLNLDDFDLILDSARMSAEECHRESSRLSNAAGIFGLPQRPPNERATALLREAGSSFAGLAVPERLFGNRRSRYSPASGIDPQEAAIARVEQHCAAPRGCRRPPIPCVAGNRIDVRRSGMRQRRPFSLRGGHKCN